MANLNKTAAAVNNAITAINARQLLISAMEGSKKTYQAHGSKVDAAKAGRNVYIDELLARRREYVDQVAAKLVKNKMRGGIDITSAIGNAAGRMVEDYETILIVDIAFGQYLSEVFGGKWSAYVDPRLAAYSVKAENSDNWTQAKDKHSVIELMRQTPVEWWLERGFWASLKNMIADNDGVELINDSEYFECSTLSHLFKIRAQLTWWASFEETAKEIVEKAKRREQAARLSNEVNGCNTHYLGEAEEYTKEKEKLLEKSQEASYLLHTTAVAAFLRELVELFDVCDKGEPMEAKYDPEVEHEKQLKTMEEAQGDVLASLDAMLAKAKELAV